MDESLRHPERDKRTRDPRRFRHDKVREAEAMIAQWERSRAPDAAEQLHWWCRKRLDIPQEISRPEGDE